MKTLDVAEAAYFLKVHENRVREFAAEGRIPAAKIGRAWVFLDEDLVGFLKKEVRDQTESRIIPRRKYGSR